MKLLGAIFALTCCYVSQSRTATLSEKGHCPLQNQTLCGDYCCVQDPSNGYNEICYGASECLLIPRQPIGQDKYAVAINAYSLVHVCSTSFGLYQCSDDSQQCCGASLCCNQFAVCSFKNSSYQCIEDSQIRIKVVVGLVLLCLLVCCLCAKFCRQRLSATPIPDKDVKSPIKQSSSSFQPVLQSTQPQIPQLLLEQEQYPPEENSDLLVTKADQSEVQQIEITAYNPRQSSIQSHHQSQNREVQQDPATQ